MVSNAFDKSRKIPIVYCTLSMVFVILSVNSIVAISVDLFYETHTYCKPILNIIFTFSYCVRRRRTHTNRVFDAILI